MDIVLNPIVPRLVDTLIDLVKENLHLILGVPEEIQKLSKMLRSIQDVLNDAQQRQITEQGVKRWLARLTDVMYDADDILDEYRITAEEQASWEESSVCCRMWPLFACSRQVKFTHNIGSQIRDLNQRLEGILADRFKFDFRIGFSVPDRQKVVARVRRETSPGVEPDIVGEAIEKNTRHLIDLLKKEEEKANSNVVVLAIVGLGGIGKTTLAQKIFNDDKIKGVFQKTMWVCVSQEFVQTDLLREIITSAGSSAGEARSKAQLEIKVKDVLKDIKFLLVLDDVWDVQIWEDLLRKLLQVGAIGSRVLVTTRNQSVAERMKAIHIHNVDTLSLDDSWLLLCRKVTKDADEEIDVQSLKDIGMKIVEKCGGLPLAITVLGGVLCGKFSRWEWERVERSSTWSRTGLPDGVHQALYLSYEDLPSHLKLCFLHCSLFREDNILGREVLVQLWIAEGFVVEVEGEEYPSLEEISDGYYEELVQRSLLQGYGAFCCRIHDLLRSLCQFLARGENSVIKDIYKHAADDESIKLRRLSIVAPEYQDFKPFLHLTQRHKSVRTLLLDSLRVLDDKDLHNCFKNFQHLRVVHLCGTTIRFLPQSIGNLLHLRYLNLLNCTQLKALPESIANSKYLQFLILSCTDLRALPKGVVKLRNLRTLDLDSVQLKELPLGIARLQHLNVLRGAVVSSRRSLCSLEEISKLRRLRELSIFKLGKTSGESNPNVNGFNSSFTALSNLVTLHLFCRSYILKSRQVGSYTEGETDRIEKIFDVALHPPSCVRDISIHDFFGRQFPRWLMSHSISSLLPNLTNLRLTKCGSCLQLPPLGKLPNLETLHLGSLDEVRSISAQFYGYKEASTSVRHESGGSKRASSSSTLFPRLKYLHLSSLSNLEVWHWVVEDGGTVAMPRLNGLHIYNCPKLMSLPEGLNRQATCLTTLSIENMNINSINGFPYVKYLSIGGEIGLKIVSHLPALEVLTVNLTESSSNSLPDWLVQGLPHLTSLHNLKLNCRNKQLLDRCLQDGPDWLKISHIPVIHIHDWESNSYISYIKDSSTFETNII